MRPTLPQGGRKHMRTSPMNAVPAAEKAAPVYTRLARTGRSWRIAVAALLAVMSASVAVGIAGGTAGAASTQVLEAWGDNVNGQLGNGTTTQSTTAVAVQLPSGVSPVASAAGGYHSLAIGSDNTLYSWGQNGFGQLGNGTTTDSHTPVAISLPGGVQATAVAAGLIDSLALGSNGKSTPGATTASASSVTAPPPTPRRRSRCRSLAA